MCCCALASRAHTDDARGYNIYSALQLPAICPPAPAVVLVHLYFSTYGHMSDQKCPAKSLLYPYSVPVRSDGCPLLPSNELPLIYHNPMANLFLSPGAVSTHALIFSSWALRHGHHGHFPNGKTRAVKRPRNDRFHSGTVWTQSR